MKKILLTVSIAFAFCGARAQWINQTLPPIVFDSYLNDIEVTDANTVWANPQDGTTGATTQYTQYFVRTIDGGNNWSIGTIVGSPVGNAICNIWPIDGNTCYVAMYDAAGTVANMGVWKTTDGGNTWNEVGTNMFTAATSFTDFVYFWDTQNGMAMGDPIGNPKKYEIYLTSDGGATWNAVPAANLPALTNAAEYGITNLFSHADGYVWFGTTYGDIYRSVDGGNNWTKAASGLPAYTGTAGRQDISDVAFSDSLHGIAMQINATTFLLSNTSDGGLTWNPLTPVGPCYPSDIDGIPGTSTFVSGGSTNLGGTTPYFGSSYSTDGGATWTTLDSLSSHTGLDFLDINTGWSGEFIPTGTGVGGAWKFTGIPIPVPCGSSNVSPGTTVPNSDSICFNQTLTLTTSGVTAPTDGAVHGFSLLVSSADISGNNDPLNSGSIVGATGVIVSNNPPATTLLNDGTVFPAGIYYFTPVVYGNATGSGPNLASGYVLDPNCTNTGASVMITLFAQGDPGCTVGIAEQSAGTFDIKNIYPVPAMENVNVVLNAKNNATVSVSVKDFIGREVYAKQFTTVKGENTLTLDLSNQNAGVYFLTVTGNESTLISKFVKE